MSVFGEYKFLDICHYFKYKSLKFDELLTYSLVTNDEIKELYYNIR